MIQATLPRRAAQDPGLGGIDLNQLARQALEPWAQAYDAWRTGVDRLARAPAPSASHCGCPTCRPDPCVCRCCVTDADLVVEARVGERRIVPIVIENRWRRERDVELELSSWTRIGDDVAVRGAIVSDAAFKLEPCGRVEVVLVLEVAGEQDFTTGKTLDGRTTAGKLRGQATAEGVVNERRRLADVTRCEVAYADLRIKGCDMRSVRIAVAVLPRDCGAFAVDCGCACC